MSQPSRRKLLYSASLVPFSAVRGSAANSAVTVGLLGCGNRGSYLGQVLTEHTQARLTSLCDLNPAAIAKTRQKIGRSTFAVFDAMDKMLASPVDAVIVATPVFLHPEHFEKAVQAGKHVYLEKPAAPDVGGCRRIDRAAAGAARDRDLGFGFQRRHGEVYKTAYEFLRSGKIGPVRMASARFVKSGAAPGTPVLSGGGPPIRPNRTNKPLFLQGHNWFAKPCKRGVADNGRRVQARRCGGGATARFSPHACLRAPRERRGLAWWPGTESHSITPP